MWSRSIGDQQSIVPNFKCAAAKGMSISRAKKTPFAKSILAHKYKEGLDRVSFHPLLEMATSVDLQDAKVFENDDGSQLASPLPTSRPPIVYSSPGAFARSFAARWSSVWTRRFILSLLAGQVVSLCITCTNVTTTELVNRGWTLSTTQGFFTCISYFLPFYQKLTLVGAGTLFYSSSIPPTRYTNVRFIFYFQWIQRLMQFFFTSSDGFKGWGKVIARDGWKCLLSILYAALGWLNFVRYHSGSIGRRREFFSDQGK